MTTTSTDDRPRSRIDPRIRERRIEVQRAAGRRRLHVLLVLSSVLCAVGLIALVVMSPVLDVDHIRVHGDEHVTADQVRAAAGVHLHDHLLLVDTGAAARRIERLAWIEHAVVHRDLPGTLSIVVTEYTPTAYVPAPGGVLLVAADGHVIASAPAASKGLVAITGIRRLPAVGSLLAPPDAAGLVTRLPLSFASRVAAVDVGGSGLALDLVGGGQVRLGDASDLALKIESAQAVLAQLGATHFTYVDVSSYLHPVSR